MHLVLHQGQSSLVPSSMIQGENYTPPGLSKKFCSTFIDIKTTCPHGINCEFVHGLFPKDFTGDNDVRIMKEWVKETENLSWNPKLNLNDVSDKKTKMR